MPKDALLVSKFHEGSKIFPPFMRCQKFFLKVALGMEARFVVQNKVIASATAERKQK